ncbi:MAG: hypothetical protein H8J66_14805 [Nitrospira sp.]|nr:hypothetical protein [Nitrospira sp.]
MNLTEKQRQRLGESEEWRELQFQKMNLYSYLGNTRLEDLQFDGLHDALEQLSLRVAAFFETWPHSQGGHDGNLDPGAVCIAGGIHDEYSGLDADASSEHASGEAPGASGPDAKGGRFFCC